MASTTTASQAGEGCFAPVSTRLIWEGDTPATKATCSIVSPASWRKTRTASPGVFGLLVMTTNLADLAHRAQL